MQDSTGVEMIQYVYKFKCGNIAVFFDNDKEHHSVMNSSQTIEFSALKYRIKKIVLKKLNLTYRQWACKLNSH